LEKEGIPVTVERSWVTCFKPDRVHRVPEGKLGRVGGDLIQSHKQLFCVRNGPNEYSAAAEIGRHIFEHTANFGLALKCVMHAELHRNDIEGLCKLGAWDAPYQGL